MTSPIGENAVVAAAGIRTHGHAGSPEGPAAASAPRRTWYSQSVLDTASLAAKLTLLFGLAIAIRAWILAVPGLGHELDLELFARWTRSLVQHGLSGFYQAEGFCDYTPLMLLAFYGLGWTTDALVGGVASEATLHMAVKALAGLFDLLTGVLLFIEGRRLLGVGRALVCAALYLLNPVAIYNSAFWGQVDSVYTSLLLLTLVMLTRRQWIFVGIAAAVSLSAKFQAIAVLPIVLFEAFRLAGLRALGLLLVGAIAGAAIVAAPFALNDALSEALQRSYVRVVGQYTEISKNAYNLWYVLGIAEAADIAPPEAVARVAAGSEQSVSMNASWLMRLTWRNISLILFTLSVAIVLSLYALRPGNLARYAAAGLLALCFFLFPTEMHERYAHPANALLAVWAAARASHERVYWALTILLLLNLAAVLPAEPLAPQIGAANQAVFVVILGALLWRRPFELARGADQPDQPAAQRRPRFDPAEPPTLPIPAWRRLVIYSFQGATVVALLAAIGGAAWIGDQARQPQPRDARVVWLDSLQPEEVRQAYRKPAPRRTVSGGLMLMSGTVYLRGVGSHAPAKLVYRVPAGAAMFEALAGIDSISRNFGTATVRVRVDGKVVWNSQVLRGGEAPQPIAVPVGGAQHIMLEVDTTRDGPRRDHVNLALARFTRAEPAASASQRSEAYPQRD